MASRFLKSIDAQLITDLKYEMGITSSILLHLLAVERKTVTEREIVLRLDCNIADSSF